MPSIEDQPFVATNTNQVVSQSFSWWGFFVVVLFLLVILLVSLLLIRSFKKSNLGIRGTGWVRVLDKQPMGSQTTLYLVEIAGKLQILGGTAHNLVKVSEIEDPNLAAEILEEIALRPVETPSGIISFLRENLTKFRRRRKFDEELQSLLEEEKL